MRLPTWGQDGRYGLGTILGLALVAFALSAIVYDMTGHARQPQPPPFLGRDTEPARVEACSTLDRAEVQIAIDQWAARFWPEWPDAIPVPCGTRTHTPAPLGVIRYRDCADGMRLDEGELFIPCPPGRMGATYARIYDGRVVSADVYVATPRALVHETGHARGLLVTPEEDRLTPYVRGAHTEQPGHVMSEAGAGHRWTWLNRGPAGDWPHEVTP